MTDCVHSALEYVDSATSRCIFSLRHNPTGVQCVDADANRKAQEGSGQSMIRTFPRRYKFGRIFIPSTKAMK